jgi:DNA-binding HxlR family transcriptional regulator
MDNLPSGDVSSGQGNRVGGTILSLLARPLVVSILRAHLDGPLRLLDVRERIGGAPQSTLRAQVTNLRGIGALVRHVRNRMPYTVENELSEVGHAIVGVADATETWLNQAPLGPIVMGSEAAKVAIKTLVSGWDSSMLHALAIQPLSLTQLNGVIVGLSYPALERRLSAMRAARQVEALPGQASGRPYAVTDWTRQAVKPLAIAGRCECQHLRKRTTPPSQADIETAFLLAVPLAKLPASRSGSCLLAVAGRDSGPAARGGGRPGVEVVIERGEVISCFPAGDRESATRVYGPMDRWFEALAAGCPDSLTVSGDHALVTALIRGLRTSFAAV